MKIIKTAKVVTIIKTAKVVKSPKIKEVHRSAACSWHCQQKLKN
jgi:hypothetical protein